MKSAVQSQYGLQRKTLRIAGTQKVLLNNGTSLIKILNQLDPQGKKVDNNTYASIIRWCADRKDLCHGQRIHAHIRAGGRDRNTFLANVLVQMYGKCGSVEDAQNVFNEISKRNIFSWNSMIAAYTQNGHEAQAMQVYKCMKMEGVRPDKFTFLPILSASASLRDLAEGKEIHQHIIGCGYETDIAVRNALVNMYGKCGSLKDARTIFDKMNERDVISWTAMIAAYTENGYCREALELFRQMDLEGIKPDRVTFLSVLNTCANLGSLEHGRTIHESIVSSGYESDITVKNSLLNMYGKCGSLRDALVVFDSMHDRNVISWTAMIAAYVLNGYAKKAIEIFGQMVLEGIRPDKITFLSTLDACANSASLEKGRVIHECIVAAGFESDIAISSTLVNMYGKCGSLKDARAVFNKAHKQNVVLWTAMIAAYSQNGYYTEAFELFRQMDLEGVNPDRVMFLSILEVCANLGSLETGRAIHECILASGFDSDVAVKNALVSMYGKCGSLKDARGIFDEICERNVISWTAIIGAYVQNGQGKGALQLFQQMNLEGVKPGRSTFVSALDACASLASLENGKAIHECIVASGFDTDVAVRNTLVHMYGKCGSLKDACEVFDATREPDVISLTAMIAAYVQNDRVMEALKVFGQIDLECVKPDRIIFLSILNACSHVGLLEVGWQYFISMSRDYGITPSEEHYVCMSDLLGRAGCLNEAEDLIMNMPNETNTVAWTTLLGSCRIHGDIERGTRATEHAFELDPENASTCILLSNIYASASRWEDAAKMRNNHGRGLEEATALLNPDIR